VSKLCRGKTTVLETDVGLYTSHQSAKSPKNIKDEISPSENMKVRDQPPLLPSKTL